MKDEQKKRIDHFNKNNPKMGWLWKKVKNSFFKIKNQKLKFYKISDWKLYLNLLIIVNIKYILKNNIKYLYNVYK